MQTATSECDVLIVGAGPTGLTMANELSRHGVHCRIIDVAPEPTTFSKAIGVQARTLELFEKLDLAERAVAQGIQVHGAKVFSQHKRIVDVDFTRKIPGHYSYVLILPQDHTEHLLIDCLQEQNVPIEREVKLLSFTQDETGVAVLLSHKDGREERVRAAWLLGCDGPHSLVRHTLGLQFAGSTFDESFVLADVQLENWSFPRDRIAVFLHNGDTVAYFPLPNGRFRVIIAYKPGAAPAGEATLEELQKAIDLCGPEGIRAYDPNWISRFRINQRKVRRYSQDRVFLLGDAAHIHSPVAAQGMNTGIQDVFNLAWKLALVIHSRAHSDLLASYQAEREPVGRALLFGTNLFSRIAFLRHPLATGLRDRVASLISRLQPAQKLFATTISQLNISYRHSPIVRDYREKQATPLAGLLRSNSGPHAGDRAPDALVAAGNGKDYRRLFDLLHSTRHVLLVFADQHEEQADAIFSSLVSGYSDLVDAYLVTSNKSTHAEEKGYQALSDASGTLYHIYGIDKTGLVLIRPDGYIGLYSQSLAIDHLQSYFSDVFLPQMNKAPTSVAP